MQAGCYALKNGHLGFQCTGAERIIETERRSVRILLPVLIELHVHAVFFFLLVLIPGLFIFLAEGALPDQFKHFVKMPVFRFIIFIDQEHRSIQEVALCILPERIRCPCIFRRGIRNQDFRQKRDILIIPDVDKRIIMV